MDKELHIDLTAEELATLIWKARRDLYEGFKVDDLSAVYFVDVSSSATKVAAKMYSHTRLRLKLVATNMDIFSKPEPTEIPPSGIKKCDW